VASRYGREATSITSSPPVYGPDYRTPFSWQFNVGVQRQLKPGTVLTVDYIRNVGLHYLMYYDTNHLGDIRYFNKTAALAAIDATHSAYGCPQGVAGINCRFGEDFTIEPTVAVFNLFNFANYDSFNAPLSGELNGGAGSVNGTTQGLRSNRIGLGTGVFSLGAPRQFEFGVRVTF